VPGVIRHFTLKITAYFIYTNIETMAYNFRALKDKLNYLGNNIKDKIKLETKIANSK
jgi:hypothetical protein